jgi:hypothetical protein
MGPAATARPWRDVRLHDARDIVRFRLVAGAGPKREHRLVTYKCGETVLSAQVVGC